MIPARPVLELVAAEGERDAACIEVERLRCALRAIAQCADLGEAVTLARRALDASKRRHP